MTLCLGSLPEAGGRAESAETVSEVGVAGVKRGLACTCGRVRWRRHDSLQLPMAEDCLVGGRDEDCGVPVGKATTFGRMLPSSLLGVAGWLTWSLVIVSAAQKNTVWQLSLYTLERYTTAFISGGFDLTT